MADPYPKTRQLARGERRYRRKVASPKQWAAIRAEKGYACRLAPFGHQPPNCWGAIEYHHLVSRGRFGDDVADNLVPLCRAHHLGVTNRGPSLQLLAEHLTDAEYAYVVGQLGEGAIGRLFGV